MGSDFCVLPCESVKQVAASMAIEKMYVSKEFLGKMVKVANGELSVDDVCKEVVEKYGR